MNAFSVVLVKKELRANLSGRYRILSDRSVETPDAVISVRCKDPVQAGMGGMAVLGMITFGVLPIFESHRVSCDAEVLDLQGQVLWSAGVERTIRAVFSSLPYPVIFPHTDATGGAFTSIAKQREQAERAVKEFAREISWLLNAEYPRLAAALPPPGA